MAPERKRSARDYEQALRRQELVTGRALVQALPADGPPGARELAAARRVLTQGLFELRRLVRDLDHQIETLRSRARSSGGAARPRSTGAPAPGSPEPKGRARPGAAVAPAGRAGQTRGVGPGELDRFEAVRNAVEEVAERWEGRRAQLGAELERRQPRQGRRAGQPRQRPGQRAGRAGGGGEVSGRGGAAPARPARPRSPRSRRSPG